MFPSVKDLLLLVGRKNDCSSDDFVLMKKLFDVILLLIGFEIEIE